MGKIITQIFNYLLFDNYAFLKRYWNMSYCAEVPKYHTYQVSKFQKKKNYVRYKYNLFKVFLLKFRVTANYT